jgi:two-component sensor histidine kinase/CheY-like chemotaxis protein
MNAQSVKVTGVGTPSPSEQRTSDLVALLGHELLNPLAAVRNATTIMRRTAWADPAHQSALAITERQIDHLIVLVQGFLDAGRLGHGKIKLNKQRVLVAEVIRRAVELVRPLLDSHRQSLFVALPPMPVYVEGDVDRLTQVLSNLLHNAVKYTHDGGHLTVRLQRAGDEAVLTVADNGIGIAPALLSHVFELFRQADEGAGRFKSGLGIGLNVASRLVAQHGGRLDASSAGEGLGAEFTIRLPLLHDLNDSPPLAAPSAAASARRMLLVDDSADAAESISMLARVPGLELNWTLHAHDGVRLARELQPDLILLHRSPAAIGDRLVSRLREQARPRQPVVVGLMNDRDRHGTLEADCDHMLSKPLNVSSWAQLAATLRAGPTATAARALCLI